MHIYVRVTLDCVRGLKYPDQQNGSTASSSSFYCGSAHLILVRSINTSQVAISWPVHVRFILCVFVQCELCDSWHHCYAHADTKRYPFVSSDKTGC